MKFLFSELINHEQEYWTFCMILFKTAHALQLHLSGPSFKKPSSGFVLTMGALHKGHLELIKHCKQAQQLTIASIFVNPTQFNDPADFTKYPVTIENDIRLLEGAGCDILFIPTVAEIYPQGFHATMHYELGGLENILEGFYRPGHFQGVCQVVHRLVDIVKPGHLYLGRKDYQQCLVIKKMLDLTGHNIQVHIVPTVRERDGLAMSSRNMRLNETERKQALSIYRQMMMIKERIKDEPVSALVDRANANLLLDGFSKIDYVSVVNPQSLLPVSEVRTGEAALVLVAASLNNVRLIDNMEIIG
ncbi:pantoate--beta-alanine ligase [soil metagenome]